METLIERLLANFAEHEKRAERLLEKSEDRIDRTNEMVCRLANASMEIVAMARQVNERLDRTIQANTLLLQENQMLIDILSKKMSGTSVNNNFNK